MLVLVEQMLSFMQGDRVHLLDIECDVAQIKHVHQRIAVITKNWIKRFEDAVSDIGIMTVCVDREEVNSKATNTHFLPNLTHLFACFSTTQVKRGTFINK